MLLQAVDVVAEGLLGDIQPLGRPGHVQVLGQLLKIVETDEIHGKPPCPATKFLCRKMKKSLFDFWPCSYYHDFNGNANDFMKNIQDQ